MLAHLIDFPIKNGIDNEPSKQITKVLAPTTKLIQLYDFLEASSSIADHSFARIMNGKKAA